MDWACERLYVNFVVPTGSGGVWLDHGPECKTDTQLGPEYPHPHSPQVLYMQKYTFFFKKAASPSKINTDKNIFNIRKRRKMNTYAQLKVNWGQYSKIIIMAFCFRVFPNISLMGKERKKNKIPFSSEIKAPMKNSVTTRFFTSLAGHRNGHWPLPSTNFPHNLQGN